MDYEIDARGLACPAPVMRTSQALGEIEKGRVLLIVDNTAVQDNIRRFAQGKGFIVSIEKRGDGYHLTITKN